MRERELAPVWEGEGNNADLGGNNRGLGLMARPSIAVTERQRRQVKSMVALGLRQEEIATLLEMTPKTLRKHFRSELDKGALEANTEVMRSLFKMATSGKNTAATIFWVKTRCGLRERARGEQEVGQEVPPLVVRLD